MGDKMFPIWNNAIGEMADDIRKYFKCISENFTINRKQSLSNAAKRNAEKMKKILDEAEIMTEVVKSKIPNNTVMFPLLIEHFEENQDLLFQVFDISEEDSVIKSKIGPTPTLVVKGANLYDERSQCYVYIENQNLIKTNDVLEGIFIVFICYYCFGYSYPIDLAKTCEFIQRIILKINPKEEADKRAAGAKRRLTNFDMSVKKLGEELNSFTNKFRV